MNPCEVGLVCPYCVPSDDDVDMSLCCTYPVLIVPNHWSDEEFNLASECECPLVEKSSELYDWLQVMDDPTVQLAIEKANKVLHDRATHRRMRIEEQEKKVDRDDPF